MEVWFSTSIARDIRREDPKRTNLRKLFGYFAKYNDQHKIKYWKLLLIRKWFYTHVQALENYEGKRQENVATEKKSLKTSETHVPSLQKPKIGSEMSFLYSPSKDTSSPYLVKNLPRLKNNANLKRMTLSFSKGLQSQTTSKNFYDFTALQIAQGLTEVEWRILFFLTPSLLSCFFFAFFPNSEMFVAIPETEFFDAKWVQQNPTRESDAPHLVHFVNHFNRVTLF